MSETNTKHLQGDNFDTLGGTTPIFYFDDEVKKLLEAFIKDNDLETIRHTRNIVKKVLNTLLNSPSNVKYIPDDTNIEFSRGGITFIRQCICDKMGFHADTYEDAHDKKVVA